MAPLRTIFRDHRLRRPDHFIEIIEYRGAFDQHLAVLEHQRRHPPQRIERRDLVTFAKGRPRPVLESKAIQPQRNRHAPGEWGIVLADQDHGVLRALTGLNRYRGLAENLREQTKTLQSLRGASKAKPPTAPYSTTDVRKILATDNDTSLD